MHNKEERRCIACRTNKQKLDMLRISRFNGEVFIDNSQKSNGRGAYICKESKCIELTIKKRLLNRAFKSNLDSSIYEQLGEYEKNN